ncbi:SagB/ThcOx family dehydrogenase [Chitinimonas lacunae]|uniref:SagB/ThcOx family dehydrogenase n=1 Tax=Chitinimonas lacunae TaxID=1963018 RepID=A0ABV8MNN4_9NEIS
MTSSTPVLVNSQPTDPDRLYEIFHENTKHRWSQDLENRLRIGSYLIEERSIRETANNYKVYQLAERLALPSAEPLEMATSTALARRVSSRQFNGQSITLNELSNLLYHGAACTRQGLSASHRDVELHFRNYPSGGGLYPIEVYPVLLRVEGQQPMITHYDPLNHRLDILQRDISLDALHSAFAEVGELLAQAAVVVFMTSVFARSTVKYNDRGYRLCLLEAGHLAQNLCITTAASGLSSLVHAGYDDDAAARWLDCDGVNEAVVHSVFIGHPHADDPWFASRNEAV